MKNPYRRTCKNCNNQRKGPLTILQKPQKRLFAVIAVTSRGPFQHITNIQAIITEETMEKGTDLKVVAQLTNLPVKLLWKMHREGIIGNPVEDGDLRGLAMISDIWRREWFLRMALGEFSHARRLELIQKPELNRVERYVLKCYLNAKKGERIRVRDIIGRIEHYLNARISENQVQRIRAMAYEIRRGRRPDPQEE